MFIIDQVPYEAALQTAVANVKSAEAALATAQLTYESKEELYKGECGFRIRSEYGKEFLFWQPKHSWHRRKHRK